MDRRGNRRNRRQFLRQTVGALMGTVLLARRGAPAGATSRDSLEVCFWRREQQVCSGGRLEEYWCYYCCVGSGCEVLGCEWRVVGTC